MPAINPTCSIVIPWHRDLADLTRAVESVRAQSVADLEVIVVANGVDDSSWTSVVGLVDDPRYRTIRLEAADVAAARNTGLDHALGTLVFFLDADDRFHPEKLARFVALHDREGFDIAFSRGLRQRGNDVTWPFPIEAWNGTEDLSEFFFCRGNTISASAIVLDRRRRSDLRFDPPPYEDPGILLKARALGFRVLMLSEPLYDWSDEREQYRLSRVPDFAARLAWIERSAMAATPRAKAAFRARCVGQHLFPSRPFRCLQYFAEALRTRSVAPAELALFLLRGLLPTFLKARGLNAYFLLRSAASQRGLKPGH